MTTIRQASMPEHRVEVRELFAEYLSPYKESEIPVEYRKHWVFMELSLAHSSIAAHQ
jgi:hypothetical protein